MNEIEDAGPLFFFIKGMNKEQIIQAVETAVKERGCFLVEVTVSAENDIEIVIEKDGRQFRRLSGSLGPARSGLAKGRDSGEG